MIDALEIAQSETIPEPRRGRKLEFIANHALRGKNITLATDIARDIEAPAPRARVLLAVATRERDAALLQEVDQLSAEHKLGCSIDRGLMWQGSNTEQYRVGVNAAYREHARLARSKLNGISESEAEFRNAKYVVELIAASFDRGNTRALDPIANEVAEALAVATELHRQQLEGNSTYLYMDHAFGIAEVEKLAAGFSNSAPEASRALYKVIKKIADNNIKRMSKRIVARRVAARKPTVPIVDQGRIGFLLDQEEIAREFGLAAFGLTLDEE